MPADWLPWLPPVGLGDAVVCLIVLSCVVEDCRRGLLHGLLETIATLAALAIAAVSFERLAAAAGSALPFSPVFTRVAAFGLVALIVGPTIVAIGRAIFPYGRLRPLAIFSGALRASLVVALLQGAVTAFPFPDAIRQPAADSFLASSAAEWWDAPRRFLADATGQTVSDAIAMVTVRPESDQSLPLKFSIERPGFSESAEARMLSHVNEDRAAVGLGPLVVDPSLRDVARLHSADMLQRGYFAHLTPDGISPFDRMRAGGVTFLTAGENLALAPNVDVAHRGLMNSPGHRANILNGRYRRVGIGAADAGWRGMMFTQNFAD